MRSLDGEPRTKRITWPVQRGFKVRIVQNRSQRLALRDFKRLGGLLERLKSKEGPSKLAVWKTATIRWRGLKRRQMSLHRYCVRFVESRTHYADPLEILILYEFNCTQSCNGRRRRSGDQHAVYQALSAMGRGHERSILHEEASVLLETKTVVSLDPYKERICCMKQYLKVCQWAAKYSRANLVSMCGFALRRPGISEKRLFVEIEVMEVEFLASYVSIYWDAEASRLYGMLSGPRRPLTDDINQHPIVDQYDREVVLLSDPDPGLQIRAATKLRHVKSTLKEHDLSQADSMANMRKLTTPSDLSPLSQDHLQGNAYFGHSRDSVLYYPQERAQSQDQKQRAHALMPPGQCLRRSGCDQPVFQRCASKGLLHVESRSTVRLIAHLFDVKHVLTVLRMWEFDPERCPKRSQVLAKLVLEALAMPLAKKLCSVQGESDQEALAIVLRIVRNTLILPGQSTNNDGYITDTASSQTTMPFEKPPASPSRQRDSKDEGLEAGPRKAERRFCMDNLDRARRYQEWLEIQQSTALCNKLMSFHTLDDQGVSLALQDYQAIPSSSDPLSCEAVIGSSLRASSLQNDVFERDSDILGVRTVGTNEDMTWSGNSSMAGSDISDPAADRNEDLNSQLPSSKSLDQAASVRAVILQDVSNHNLPNLRLRLNPQSLTHMTSAAIGNASADNSVKSSVSGARTASRLTTLATSNSHADEEETSSPRQMQPEDKVRTRGGLGSPYPLGVSWSASVESFSSTASSSSSSPTPQRNKEAEFCRTSRQAWVPEAADEEWSRMSYQDAIKVAEQYARFDKMSLQDFLKRRRAVRAEIKNVISQEMQSIGSLFGNVGVTEGCHQRNESPMARVRALSNMYLAERTRPGTSPLRELPQAERSCGDTSPGEACPRVELPRKVSPMEGPLRDETMRSTPKSGKATSRVRSRRNVPLGETGRAGTSRAGSLPRETSLLTTSLEGVFTCESPRRGNDQAQESKSPKSLSRKRSVREDSPAKRSKTRKSPVPRPGSNPGPTSLRGGGDEESEVPFPSMKASGPRKVSRFANLWAEMDNANDLVDQFRFFNASNGASGTSTSSSSLHKLFDSYRGKSSPLVRGGKTEGISMSHC